MSELYEEYKPLRNLLRRVGLENSLGAIRWYITYTQLRNPPLEPSDIKVIPDFKQLGIRRASPWYLAILVRELIINSDPIQAQKDFRDPSVLMSALTKLAEIDDSIAKKFLNQTNIYQYVSRILPHQQFSWQENRPNYQTMTRYYCIYNSPELKVRFKDFYGISLEQYIVISLLLWQNFNTNFGMNYPPRFETENSGIGKEEYDKYLKFYAAPFEEVKSNLISEHRVDRNFMTYFDSLRVTPLLLTKNTHGQLMHICPVPTHLYWRNTDGIYYDFMYAYRNDKTQREDFGHELGDSYSNYIGMVLSDQEFSGRSVSVVDVDEYLPNDRPKPDWFIEDGDCLGYIECKTKRMTLKTKTEFDADASFLTDLTKLAENIVQCYKAILHAKQQNYEFVDTTKTPFPIIVTLETWYLQGRVYDELQEILEKDEIRKGLDVSIYKKYPYAILSTFDLENLAFVLRSHTLQEVMSKFALSEFSGWNFGTFLMNTYRDTMGDYELFKSNPLDPMLTRITGIDFTPSKRRH